jgi:predicted alpha/beta superfamily hydrolase
MKERTKSVSIYGARRIDFVSAVNGHRYSISVARPLHSASPKGYRAMYVLDAHAYFGSVVEAVRFNLRASDVVVVGIGYPDDAAFVRSVLDRHAPLPAWLSKSPAYFAACNLERRYDLSLPTSEEKLAEHGATGIRAEYTGGLDDFLETIEVEAKPRVAAMYPVDPSAQAIFGHSLGGLAVVHALFCNPSAFRSFIASSPSLWWDGKVVLAGEAKFTAAVTAGEISPRVLITMGEEEDKVSPDLAAKLQRDPAELKASAASARMVDNARELVERLKSLRGSGSYAIEDYALFPKQGHTTAPWPAIGRAMRFAFE